MRIRRRGYLDRVRARPQLRGVESGGVSFLEYVARALSRREDAHYRVQHAATRSGALVSSSSRARSVSRSQANLSVNALICAADFWLDCSRKTPLVVGAGVEWRVEAIRSTDRWAASMVAQEVEIVAIEQMIIGHDGLSLFTGSLFSLAFSGGECIGRAT